MRLFGKKKRVDADTGTSLPPEKLLIDIQDKSFWELFHQCKPFTMTSPERMYALYQAVNYVLTNNIPGDFVECGVWKGGSALLMARMLAIKNITTRKVFLYDTYEGMTEPGANDKDYTGKDARSLLEQSSIEVQESVWCYSSFDEVRANLSLSGLPADNIVLIKGKVEETIPEQIPAGAIALLRLDTDWYESTRHELIHLYPLLSRNGVLIIDDYGHWEGCRKAVDEYIRENQLSLLLNRIDNTGRVAIKNV
jgi:hypothetical protein